MTAVVARSIHLLDSACLDDVNGNKLGRFKRLEDGMAPVLVSGQEFARQYYRMFPQEPILPNTTIEIDAASRSSRSFSTLTDVLRAILDSNSRDILIVCHGTMSGIGIRLANRGAQALERYVDHLDSVSLQALNSDDPDIAASIRLDNDERVNSGLQRGFLPVFRRVFAEVRRLKVQIGGLERVIIRGCLIGTDENLLVQLKTLFGSQTICAPQAADWFGMFKPIVSINKRVWDRWQGNHPDAKSDLTPGRFMYDIEMTETTTTTVDSLADSWDSVKKWIQKRISEAGYPDQTAKPRVFYCHAFKTDNNNYVFPRDEEYRGLLASA